MRERLLAFRAASRLLRPALCVTRRRIPRVQHEGLHRQAVDLGVGAAEERPHRAPGDPFDGQNSPTVAYWKYIRSAASSNRMMAITKGFGRLTTAARRTRH